MDINNDEHFELINGRKVVNKHVAAIHCSNKLSLLERKISNALLFNAFSSLKDEVTHEITLDKLKSLLGCNTRNHKALKNALKTLISTVLEWNLLHDEADDLEGWNASSILAAVKVVNGVIVYQYSDIIKNLLSNPSIYGKINLIIQSRFKSAYALALYENCARFRGLKYTKNFDLELLRRLLGVGDGDYTRFYDFNRRVLSVAVTEINTCSDIRVTPDFTKRGKRIVAIKFALEERNIMKRFKADQTSEDREISGSLSSELQEMRSNQTELLDTLQNVYGFSKAQSSLLIKQYGCLYILEKIDLIEVSQAFKNGRIKNIAKYLEKALVDDYQPPKSSKDVLNDLYIKEESTKNAKERYEEQMERFHEHRKSLIPAAFDEMPEQIKISIKNAFQEYVKNSIYSRVYEQEGLDNSIIKKLFCEFVFDKYQDRLETLPSFEQFCEASLV